MELTFSMVDIHENAARFWKVISPGSVVALHGEMGAGKTTFIHALCDVKGVKDAVGSPTFSIINEYHYSQDGKEELIYHLDLYRLSGEEEAIQAGVEDCLYSGYTCFVEWPEKAAGILPPGTIHARLEVLGSAERKLLIDDK